MRRELHVLSWNLHDLPWFLAPHHADRLKRVAARVLELMPDVVTFQEVWLEEDAGPMIRTLRSHGYDAIESPDRAGTKVSGLITFIQRDSGWTMLSKRREEFRDSASPFKVWEGDGIARKGFQMTTLCHEKQGYIVVVNTHLQAQYGNGYESIRRHQLEQLLTSANALGGGGVPVLVCGDFNTDASEPLHEMFSNSAWQDLTEPYRRRCACKTNFSDRDALDMWLDYVVARRDPCLQFSADIELQTNTHKDDPFSDHQGVFAKVQIDDVVPESSLLLGVATAAAMRGPSNRRTALKKIAALVAGTMRF